MIGGATRANWRAAKAERTRDELHALGRSGGPLRLELGEQLERIAQTQAHHALGFSSLEAYARERCGLSRGFARQLRTTARRLAERTRLRQALVDGRLGFSMVELVARHVTAENEPFLVGLAQRRTIRQMRTLLRKPGESDRPKRRRLRRTVNAESAWIHEQTRMFAEAQCDSRAGDAVWEAMLAEAQSELLPWLEDEPTLGNERHPTGGRTSGPAAHEETDRSGSGQAEGRTSGPSADQDERSGSEQAEGRTPGGQTSAPAPADPEPPESPADLDRRCVRLARELALRELHIAELTLELKELTGYDGMSEAEFAERVLGMSHSSLKNKHTLVRRLGPLPELRVALEDGRIGMEAAGLVARIATQQTVEAWVERAERRTVKHLAEEVRFVEMVARLSGGVPDGPPSEADMERMHDIERGVLGGQMSGLAQAPMPDDPTGVRPAKMGRVRQSLSMSEERARQYVRLERAWDRAGQPAGDFLCFLSLCFWKAWAHCFDGPQPQYADIYRRERFVCASPTCERRDLTPHHLWFRSRGGTDDPDNVAGLCLWCHLQGIHALGSILAEPPATRMRWKTPVLEVEGREVLWRRAV